MITVTIYQNKDGQYTGFNCIGHANYAESGEDIVCAAVSVLVLNTINSLEAFTDVQFHPITDEESGLIHIVFESPATEGAELLMRSLVLGLEGIQLNYGKMYFILKFEEV